MYCHLMLPDSAKTMLSGGGMTSSLDNELWSAGYDGTGEGIAEWYVKIG